MLINTPDRIFGVTGYSLPRDQIGYWAVKIVTGVPEAIPVALLSLLLGYILLVGEICH
jgi:quinol-cytochrome oxidoreductase complex cytochrome b subunit